LPPFSPPVPSGGWTVEAVYIASHAYAESNPGDTRHVTEAAFRALLAASPALKQEEVTERLRGLDRLRFAAVTSDDPLPL
jgi:hypothetical protein